MISIDTTNINNPIVKLAVGTTLLQPAAMLLAVLFRHRRNKTTSRVIEDGWSCGDICELLLLETGFLASCLVGYVSGASFAIQHLAETTPDPCAYAVVISPLVPMLCYYYIFKRVLSAMSAESHRSTAPTTPEGDCEDGLAEPLL